MAAIVIDIGPVAHEDERDALRFLADGLPNTAVVFTNPWLMEPSGAVYELDAVVAMPHAIYVVEVKGWRGHLQGDTRDWYLPETRRSPLQLAHKTAQVLHTLLGRTSHDAGQVWTQELIFLPAAASFTSSVDAVKKRVALRGEIHALLQDVDRMRDLANRRATGLVTAEVHDALTRLLRGAPRQRPLVHVAGFKVIDRFDANDRFREVLGEDTTRTRRVLRIYRLPWQATEAEREQIRKRATWEAAVLRSFARAPEDVGLPLVDQPLETDDGLVVPMEHFDGQTLPAWLATAGKNLDLRARVGLWVRIARTLAWTHKAGVIHRQLRPDLVLVKGPLDPRDRLTPAFRVTGFEMAKRLGRETTIAWSDTALGRLEGAAPEVVQLPSNAVPASDQFSLGLVLALLVLRRPLVESTLAWVERRHRMPHTKDLDPDVPQRLDDAVARMLERKPADRYPTVEAAIAHVLAAVGDGDPEPARGLSPGARVGHDYLVEGQLGEGGLSEVYQVKHQLLGQRFALKVSRPTEVAERAIQCEFHALQSVSHPAVVRAHDLTKMVQDRITLRLDLVPGTTLSEVVKSGRLPRDDVAARRRLGEDLIGALDELERIGLVHDDLKPDNLMVTPTGKLVLIDFSLARGPAVEARMGPASTFGGTCDWRDPSGEPPGHGSDRYAAAMCLFWLHAGRHPFDGRIPEPGEAPEVDPAELEPPALAGFFDQALHPDPAGRFRAARAMREAYLQALGSPLTPDAAPERHLGPDTPLTETRLAPRAIRTLLSAGVRTVGQLLGLGEPGLARVPGLGERLIERVRVLVDEARRQGVEPRDRSEPDAPPLFRPLASDPAPLGELSIDVAVLDALRHAGLRTVADVAGRTRSELLALPNVRPPMLTRLGEALVKLEAGRTASARPVETLDAVWERATRDLDAGQRTVVELVYGLRGPPLLQTRIAERLELDPPTVSLRKTAGLGQLDRDALAGVAGALDGYLDLEHGVVPLTLACERLGRDFPTADIEPSGLIRLLDDLDTRTFRLLEEALDLKLLARPWFDRDVLGTFAETVTRVVGGWPPEPAAAARQTLRMVLPDFEGDPVLLAQRVVPGVLTTAGGALFMPPIDVGQGLLYLLEGERDSLEYADLGPTFDRVFAGAGPQVPPLQELPPLLDGTSWRVEGARIVRRGAAGSAPPRPAGDDARDLLAIDAEVDPRDRVRDVLREAGHRGSSFRLVVSAPEHHRAVARSLIDQLHAVSVDLTDAWFRRHEATLSADARASRFPALRVVTSKRVDQLLGDLVREHGAPGRTVVLHETGLLETLGGLEQIRILYDRVQGQPVGFWVVVIPGVILERRPLFNDRTPVWHLPGLVLPLDEPLRSKGAEGT